MLLNDVLLLVFLLQAKAPSQNHPRIPPAPRSSANGSAAHAGGVGRRNLEDEQLEINIQRAIELSLKSNVAGSGGGGSSDPATASDAKQSPKEETAEPQQQPERQEDSSSSSSGRSEVTAGRAADDDLSAAIRLSQQEQEELSRRQREEEDILKRVLELSMQEK